MIWGRDKNRLAEDVVLYCIASLCALAASPVLAQDVCFRFPSFVSDSPNRVFSVFAADLDGDGVVDIIEGSTLFGALAPSITWYPRGPAGDSPQIIARGSGLGIVVSASDLDGDGDMDILGAPRDIDTFSWYENDGLNPPTFAPRAIGPAEASIQSIFPTDLDGDGDMDVVTASFTATLGPGESNEIAWYENDGATPPGFTRRTISTDVIEPLSVFAADINGDGRLDVLSASSRDDKIAWYENDGMPVPGFTQHVITTNANGATGIFAADLDLDGDIDVLSANFFDSEVVWYENNGEDPPGFTEHLIAGSLGRPTVVIAADLDDDGDVDVIANSDGPTGLLYCFLSDGSQPPNFTTHATGPEGGGTPFDLIGSLALMQMGEGQGPDVVASVGRNLEIYSNALPQAPKASSQRDWMLYP